ncbi:MAG: hypothetical protein OER93_04370, partial [Thermoleophilia bacterium]|nr:hypothetical protein [Thermoleophilia bacterium]
MGSRTVTASTLVPAVVAMTVAKNAAAPISAGPPQRGRRQAMMVPVASTIAALRTARLSPVNSSGPKALPITISQKNAVARV